MLAGGNSAGAMIRSLKDRLRRLGTDYAIEEPANWWQSLPVVIDETWAKTNMAPREVGRPGASGGSVAPLMVTGGP